MVDPAGLREGTAVLPWEISDSARNKRATREVIREDGV
jgi:hypothetical protein